jgi:dienelactone hydrolase
VVLLLTPLFATPVLGENPGPDAAARTAGPAIVIGFLGGFVHRTDARHAEVQLAEKLSQEYGGQAKVGIFENHNREEAHAAVVKWLDHDGDATLSESEKRQARIVLYGHSWGGSAVLALARELQKDQIPVLLTIQIDSIAKPGMNDRVVPPNVARAVNFYQTGGALHGQRQIVAADPSRTEILGDFRLDYKAEPAPCSSYPWFARHFLKGHTSIECDPNVWSRIENMIQQSLFAKGSPVESAATALRQSPPVP